MPVDFDKLRQKKQKPPTIDPIEIFRRLPKGEGINDLYTSQSEVLQSWFQRRQSADTVVKLHTGGGKTLVALLMGQSTLNELGEPVLYLVPTRQLVTQVLEQAAQYGISAVPYERGAPLNEQFTNGKATMVGTYNALFNGRSRFGVRGGGPPQQVGGIILDDAHAAFSVVREAFTLEVPAGDCPEQYGALADLFRPAFRQIDRAGTFEEVVGGGDQAVLEVPYWAWNQSIAAVRQIISGDSNNRYSLTWPLLRDNLHLCHVLISRTRVTITPVLPLLDMFPTFIEAKRRIYTSATIADDSELVRAFGVSTEVVKSSLTSRSLAGISERMILLPSLMPFAFDERAALPSLLHWVSSNRQGAVVLTPSNEAARRWDPPCHFAEGSDAVAGAVKSLRSGESFGPFVFANRFDGIDLPGNSCRLLIVHGLPRGTSDYEIFRGGALYGGATVTRMLAQRLEQAIGRGARGAGDHCVVILAGPDLAGWIAKEANYKFLTSATRAQFEMGEEISAEVSSVDELAQTMRKCLERDQSWLAYHAEKLDELVDVEHTEDARLEGAASERKAVDLWKDGYHEKAISRLDRVAPILEAEDQQALGWVQQLAARIAEQWGNRDKADELQRQAFANNRNLQRPRVPPPYVPLPRLGPQEKALAAHVQTYRVRRGLLHAFDDIVADLVPEASSNRFEEALANLARFIGLSAERFDRAGEGPDVLWLLPNQSVFAIEAKSRKKSSNPFTKGQHGQLLVAQEWVKKHYPGHTCHRVSVHPTATSTAPAVAEEAYALTYPSLQRLTTEARALLSAICDLQVSGASLEARCATMLASSPLLAEKLATEFLVRFSEAP
jgi:replicative superfamily II helicase